MSRSDDAGGAATVDGDSARGGAGMKDEGRGLSPDASHAATGPVSGEIRRRGRRVRGTTGFAATGALDGRAGGATGAGAFGSAFLRSARLGASCFGAGCLGAAGFGPACFEAWDFGAAAAGFAGFAGIGFFTSEGRFGTDFFFGGTAFFTGFTGFTGFAGFEGFAGFTGFEGFEGFAGLGAFTRFAGAFGRAAGLTFLFKAFASTFGKGLIRAMALPEPAAAAFGFFLTAEAFAAFLPFAIGIAVPLRPSDSRNLFKAAKK